MKKTIFESQTLDYETGEITSVTTVKASNFSESFSMCRTTDKLDWLQDLDGTEIKTLLYLLELETLKQHLVTLGPISRQELADFLKIKINRVSKILKSLEDKAFLIRLNNQELKLNPKGFYKGSSKEVLPRIKEFDTVYASRISSEKPSELAQEANKDGVEGQVK